MSGATAEAVRRACDYLASRQDPDGFWREYDLVPGASTDWVTAVVGFALSGANAHVHSVRRAIDTVRANCRPSGWGYNPAVATDADTTSWVVRWFARTGTSVPLDASACLHSYLGEGGGARTFACGPRYGRWTTEHVDVTAVLGLAVSEAGLASPPAAALRAWLLGQRNERGLWPSFWWTFDAYATARVAEFLGLTGGVPADVLAASRRLVACASPSTAMETANLLMLARAIGTPAEPWLAHLLAMQRPDGSWPPSRVLKIPHQQQSTDDEPAFEDGKGLMSTAMAVMALSAGGAA